MSRRRLGPLEFPVDTTFRWRHGIAWFFYLLVLGLNLDMLHEARQSGAFYLLPAIGLAWVAVFTAGAFIENWLDGANRYRLFRLALVLSSIFSCALGVWMLWHYTTFLLVGVITLFRQPFELISLSIFGARFAAVCASLVTFAFFAWLSLRVVIILLTGKRHVHFGHVLGEDSGSIEPPATTGAPLSVRVARAAGDDEPPAIPATPVRVGDLARGYPRRARQLVAGVPPGRLRYLVRPSLPKWNAASDSFMHGLSYHRGIAEDKVGRCRELGWPAFEWVFRTEPTLQELVRALEALPNLARSVDEHDALEAREWMSRLADHPGSYEMDLPYQEIINEIGGVTIRVADVAMKALFDWDAERAKRTP
jgi:hypothetical protein